MSGPLTILVASGKGEPRILQNRGSSRHDCVPISRLASSSRLQASFSLENVVFCRHLTLLGGPHGLLKVSR
jgi:hypothetical protein